MDVAALAEIARESGEELDLATLASLALGEDGGACRAAVALALAESSEHFIRRQDRWEPRSAERLDELRKQRERASSRAAERQQALAAFARAVAGETFVPTGSDVEKKYLHALEELAVRDADAADSHRDLALEALEGSRVRGDRPAERAFRLLRAVSRFASDDENLLALRYGLRIGFPPEVVAAAEASVAGGWDRTGRRDLTTLRSITVDGPHTREIDDALSLEGCPGGWRIGVHVADASAFVAPGDAVDGEALSRTCSRYLPDLRIPMLPAAISEAAASLVEGEERPALSFLVEVDRSGSIVREEVVRSAIVSHARLTYDHADRMIGGSEGPWADDLEELFEVARRLEARRVDAGALVILTNEAEVHVGTDGVPRLERLDSLSPARRIVSEAMILAGAVAARFLVARGVPALFRRQAPPDSPPLLPAGPVVDPVLVRALRRSLRRGEVGLQPARHFALGLPAYCQATSPLRRYQDLALHRQIASVLSGAAPLYRTEDLQRIAATTERAEAEARRAERDGDLYWRLRFLERFVGTTVDAIVIDEHPTVVQLVETLLEEKVPGLTPASLGERVALRVERVNPRAEVLVLRPA